MVLSNSEIIEGNVIQAGNLSYNAYLSSDNVFSTDDRQICQNGSVEVNSESIKVNSSYRFEIYSDHIRIPFDTTPGQYYMIIERILPGSDNKPITVSDAFTIAASNSLGAFKVYNSWGVNWGASKGDDTKTEGGFYYLPIEAAMAMKLDATLTRHNSYEVYKPVVLVRFCLKSVKDKPKVNIMQNYDVYFEADSKSKDFRLSGSDTTLLPYMYYEETLEYVFDLTDFYEDFKSGSCNEVTMYLKAKKETGDTQSITCTKFVLEVYSNGYQIGSTPDKTYVSKLKSDSIEDNQYYYFVDTTGINSYMPSSVVSKGVCYDLSFETREMTEAEARALNDRFPKTPTSIDGRATGLVQSDLSSYEGILLASPSYSDEEAEKSLNARAGLQGKVDISESKYFPPVADQGSVGSCAAFATAYYSMSYEMAKEHDWDLSGVTFDSSGENELSWGPSDETRIMSPGFVYNQTNGGHGGSNMYVAQKLISNMGVCRWTKFGSSEIYKPETSLALLHDYTQPSTEAYEDATFYRLSDLDSSEATVHFNVDSFKKIMMIIECLDAGHCVIAGIDSSYLRFCFNPNAVLVGPVDSASVKLDHAQTIVGYVTGEEYAKLLSQQ